MTWILLFGYLLAAVSIWIGVWGRFGSMKTSTKQLFAVIGVFVFLIMVGITLNEIFHWWDRFPRSILGFLGVIIVIERVERIVLARKQGGAQLLDLGRIPVPDMIINVFAGLGLAWFAVTDAMQITHAGLWTFGDISLQILGVSIAVAVLIQGIGKRRILEQGVFHGTGLIRWDRIESYTWEKESTTTSILVLHKQTRIPLFKLVTLSVEVEQMEEMEGLFREHAIRRVGEPEGMGG